MQEQTMVERIRAGSVSGLEALMERYLPYVSAVVWNILRFSMSAEDAEEVVSDVFLAAWRQAEDLKPGHVKAWLGAVARNQAKNKLRQRGLTLPLEDDALEIPGLEDPAGEIQRLEERRLVRQAVDGLSPQDREIFLRHYYYAQTVKEVARQMDMKEGTVKTRLMRGRMKLKEVLMKEGFADEA